MAKISNATDVKETIRQLEIENVSIFCNKYCYRIRCKTSIIVYFQKCIKNKEIILSPILSNFSEYITIALIYRNWRNI